MNILEEADTLINGERAKTYGSPTALYERTAGMWAAYLGAPVTAANVIDMMILLKVARAQPGYHRDSFVDTAGYAAIAERLHDEIHVVGDEPGPLADWEKVLLEAAAKSAPSPRVWQSFTDVPIGVRVLDKDGDWWDGEGLEPGALEMQQKWAPFTEVVG